MIYSLVIILKATLPYMVSQGRMIKLQPKLNLYVTLFVRPTIKTLPIFQCKDDIFWPTTRNVCTLGTFKTNDDGFAVTDLYSLTGLGQCPWKKRKLTELNLHYWPQEYASKWWIISLRNHIRIVILVIVVILILLFGVQVDQTNA